MFKRWRDKLPHDSIFRKPLVSEISVVLVVKILLLIALWHLVFKPLLPSHTPNMTSQLLSNTSYPTNIKETHHE